MGGFKKTMEAQMEAQKEFQMEGQATMLKRQIAMQQLLMQRQMAMQVAKSREMFNWIAAFAGTVSFGLLAGAARTRNPKLLAPLLPMGFGTGYLYDMAHGTKMARIREDAARMIVEQDPMLSLPCGAVTFTEVEEKIKGR